MEKKRANKQSVSIELIEIMLKGQGKREAII